MAVYKVKKGLNLPLSGEPVQQIDVAPQPSHVALVAPDYVGMKPTMAVAVGEVVRRGQPLFEDKKNPGVIFTSPAAGAVTAINRGAKRAFQSIVVELSESERRGQPGDSELVRFESYTGNDPAGLSRDQIKALLVESGLWTALRTRPYSRVPAIDASPKAIFVTAIDTNPHAPSVELAIQGREKDFEKGLICVAKLTEGKTYLSKAPGAKIPANPNTGITIAEFDGPHPSGTVGYHIHVLDPVHREKTVWHLNYQDVIAIGHLFSTGELDVTRVISMAGPMVSKPRLLRTRLGASTRNLTSGELAAGEVRIISGSVLSGRTAVDDVHGYLGRYHLQISVLREGRDREFLGWMAPGGRKFSIINAFTSALSRSKKFEFTTNVNGSHRAMVPIGMYEKVMPWDIQPTFLLRALIVGDLEGAEQLGCLELDEEDLALCTFVCPGKIEYGPILRANLEEIHKEG